MKLELEIRLHYAAGKSKSRTTILFLLLKAAARAATDTALSDASQSGSLSDPKRKKLSLSDALVETPELSDASVTVSLSDPMPVIRRSALTKMGIIATPGRHLIFTHKGAKQICLVAK